MSGSSPPHLVAALNQLVDKMITPNPFGVLHLGDLHARETDIEEIEKCAETVIEAVERNRPNLIIKAGDVFDSEDTKVDSRTTRFVARFVSRLADVAPVAIIRGTSTHDGHASSVLSYIKGNYNIWVADHIEQVYLEGQKLTSSRPAVPDAVISLVPQPTKKEFYSASDIRTSDGEIAEALSREFIRLAESAREFSCPHILGGHWNTTGAYVSETQILTGVDIEISVKQMELAAADLVCLAHIHKAQQLGRNIFYCGSLYRLDYGEMDSKGFYFHTLDGRDLKESRFIETPTRKLAKVGGNFTVEPLETLGDLLEAQAVPEKVADSHVRIELQIYEDEAKTVDRMEIKNRFLAAGALSADVRISSIPRTNVRSEEVLRADSLREKLLARAKLNGEDIPESILEKADLLESEKPETIINLIKNGGTSRDSDVLAA